MCVMLLPQLCVTLCHLMCLLTLDVLGEVFKSMDLSQPIIPLLASVWLNAGDSQHLVSIF